MKCNVHIFNYGNSDISFRKKKKANKRYELQHAKLQEPIPLIFKYLCLALKLTLLL